MCRNFPGSVNLFNDVLCLSDSFLDTMMDDLLFLNNFLHVVDCWELILNLEYLNQLIFFPFIFNILVPKHWLLDVELVFEVFFKVSSLLGWQIFCLSSQFQLFFILGLIRKTKVHKLYVRQRVDLSNLNKLFVALSNLLVWLIAIFDKEGIREESSKLFFNVLTLAHLFGSINKFLISEQVRKRLPEKTHFEIYCKMAILILSQLSVQFVLLLHNHANH